MCFFLWGKVRPRWMIFMDYFHAESLAYETGYVVGRREFLGITIH
jgi:hypothetical protein